MSESLRKDKKSNPKERKGEFLWKSQENVAIFRWKDARHVYAIRNAHTPELKQTTILRKKELVRPNVAIDYNANISGID